MTEEPAPSSGRQNKEPSSQEITIEEFEKMDIRIAKVFEVSKVPNSARLLKLILDVGGVRKQCIAGIGASYEPDQLRNKLIAVVMNMKPRHIMGLTSEVMLLAAADGPEISVISSDRTLSSGAKVT